MFSSRTAILALTLGSAAVMGWLCHPARPMPDFASGGRSVDRPEIHPSPGDSPTNRPARPQKTRPDPTPEGESLPLVASLDYQGPVSLILGILGRTAISALSESPSASWSEPARDTLLLQLTHRFRC
jgi:hypothetical protein